jgi:iron complex transport system ATP-binding protein
MAHPLLAADSISFAFGKSPVVQEMSFDLAPGDSLGILGPNGAGKSTLLRLSAGILRPQVGSLSLDGRPMALWGARERARVIAFVPQETPALFPLRALELVLLGRLPHAAGFSFATAVDMRAAEEALRQCDAWAFRDRRLGTLSGGERQRIILARALAQEPRVLLLDEPTTFLDIRHQSDVVRILQDWVTRTQGAVMAALHDLNMAAHVCTRVLLLREGRVLAAGSIPSTLTRDTIRATFDTDVTVGTHPTTGRPYYVVG